MQIVCPECGASNPELERDCEACGFRFPKRGRVGQTMRDARSARDDDPREEYDEDDRTGRSRDYDDEFDEDWRGGTPHRGGTVLLFGILGVVMPCIPVFGPLAWAFGAADLTKMRADRMDDTGRGTTQAGMVLGVVGTLEMIAFYGFFFLASILG